MAMEKRRQWSFRMTRTNTWSWHSIAADGVETASKDEFDTLADCIVDAKEHGYVVVIGKEERRRESQTLE